MRSPTRRVAILVLSVGLMAALSVPVSLARFADTDPAGGSLTADTIEPPTALAATGGATVALTWTPTIDLYATGYDVRRSATSGGPYSLASSVTPGTATATTDAPASGTWYYVLRSTYDLWSSVDSVEASASVGAPLTTAEAACTAQAAETVAAGDNNGYQTNPLRACTDDGLTANDPASGTGGTQVCGVGAVPSVQKDRHQFWGYAMGLPATVSVIEGITIRADLGQSNNGGTTAVCAQLSSDGGTTWTALRSVPLAGTPQSTYTLGGPTDTWGRSWTVGDFATPAFRVRIVDASSQTNKGFQLDYLALTVTYRP